MPKFFLLLLLLFSCQSASIKSTSQKKSTEDPPRMGVLPHSVEIQFPTAVQENAEFRQIKLCKEKQCAQTNTVQDQELIFTPEQGTYTASVATCSNATCSSPVSLPPIQVAETSPEKVQLKTELETLQDTTAKKLADLRVSMQEWSNTCSTSAETKQSVERLLAVDNSVLLYLLSNLSDLPLDDPEELDALAQKYLESKTSSASSEDDSPSDQEKAGEALLYTGVALGSVALTTGFLVFLKGKEQLFKYLKAKREPVLVSQPKEIQVGKAGEVGSDVISFNGKHYKLPEGYTVSAINESFSVLEGEQTKILGKGSQGSVFVVKKDGIKKIIKFDNGVLAAGGDNVSAGTLKKIGSVFQKEDVDVARSMFNDFKNPMAASLEHVTLGEIEIPVVVKDFVEGSTLKKSLETGSLFHDTPEGLRMRADLEFGLFQRMAKGKKVYADLNPDNLIWSQKESQWIVIDAKPPISVSTEQKALRGNFDSFKLKLSVTRSGTVWSRDGVRVLMSDVAKYSPIFGSSEAKLTSDALMMEQIKRMKATIAAQEKVAFVELFKVSDKIPDTVHFGPARDEIIQANKRRLLSNRNWLIGVATLGGLAATTAIVGSVLNLVDDLPCQDMLRNLGKSKQEIMTSVDKMHALQAFYLRGVR